MHYLFFDAMQDSSKYRFADDGVSLFFLNNSMELEISKLYEIPVFWQSIQNCSFSWIDFVRNMGLWFCLSLNSGIILFQSHFSLCRRLVYRLIFLWYSVGVYLYTRHNFCQVFQVHRFLSECGEKKKLPPPVKMTPSSLLLFF